MRVVAHSGGLTILFRTALSTDVYNFVTRLRSKVFSLGKILVSKVSGSKSFWAQECFWAQKTLRSEKYWGLDNTLSLKNFGGG